MALTTRQLPRLPTLLLVLACAAPGAAAAAPKLQWATCKSTAAHPPGDLVAMNVQQLGSTCSLARDDIGESLAYAGWRDLLGLFYNYNGRNEDPGVFSACVGRTHRRAGARYLHVFCRGAGEQGKNSGGAWKYDIASKYLKDGR